MSTLAENKDKYDSYFEEMHRATKYQIYGIWDSMRAREYWRKRLPEMDISVLADVLTDLYSATGHAYKEKHGLKE